MCVLPRNTEKCGQNLSNIYLLIELPKTIFLFEGCFIAHKTHYNASHNPSQDQRVGLGNSRYYILTFTYKVN